MDSIQARVQAVASQHPDANRSPTDSKNSQHHTENAGVRSDPHRHHKIRTGNVSDVTFLDHLQTKYKGCLGYFPKVALEAYLNTGLVTVATENNDNAGYLLGKDYLRYQPGIRPIFQAAVAMDAQRRHLGLALLDQLILKAKAASQQVIQANCAADIEAIEFWKAAGFQAIVAMQPDTYRARPIITWRLCVSETLPTWFWTPPARAGWRAGTPIVKLLPINRLQPKADTGRGDEAVNPNNLRTVLRATSPSQNR
jgi:hypothetical protein